MKRWLYRLMTRYAARALRGGLTESELLDALVRCFPRRDAPWRAKFIGAAKAINRRRTMRAINGG